MKKLVLLIGLFISLVSIGQNIHTPVNTANANQFWASDTVANGKAFSSRTIRVKDFPATRTWPAPTNFGDFYNKIYWNANDLNNIQINASGGSLSSVTVNASNQLVCTASGASFLNYNYLYPNVPSMLNHWVDTTDFTVTAFGNGFASCFVGNPQGITAYLSTNSGTGTLNIANNGGSTFYRSGITGPTITLNHMYETILSLNDSVVTFSAQDLTTGGTVFSTTYTLAIAASQVPNFGHIGFFSFTGMHVISKLHINSTSSKNANLCFIVDSKGEEYSPTSFAGRWPAQVGVNYPPYNLYGGSASTIANVLSCMDQLTTINAEQYIIADEGRNDLHAGVALPIIAANITKAFNALSSGGAKVWLTIMPEDSTGGGQSGLTALKNWMAAAYPNNYIDLWTGMTTAGNNILKAAYNSGDGIHPNQAGHNFIATTINGLSILNTLDVSRLAQYAANDGNVKFVGDSLAFEFQIAKRSGFYALWNSDLNLQYGAVQDNGIGEAGVNATGATFTPYGTLPWTVNGGMATTGSNAGLTLGARDGTFTTGNFFGLYGISGRLNLYSIPYSKEIVRWDTVGHMRLNLINSTSDQTTNPKAQLEIGGNTGGLALNTPLKLDSGVLVTSPEAGAIETNGLNLFWTDHVLTRDTLADRAWVRSISGAGGATNIGSTQNATNYSLTSSTGTGTTLLTATSSLAGLLDTARAKYVDSLKNGTKIFNLYAGQGMTATGGDTLNWGGTLTQALTIHPGNNSISFGTTTIGDSISSFTLYANNASIRAINTGLLGNIAFQTSGTTGSSDANTSVGTGHNMILSASITANRTLTLGDPTVFGTGSGRELTIEIQTPTSNAFHWTASGAIYNGSNADSVTALCNGATYEVYSDGARWVMKAVSYGSTGSLESSAGTLTLSSFIQYIFTGSTTTWTLPPLNGNQGRTYHIKNIGSGNITLGVSGSDHIYDTSQVTSVPIAPGAVRTLYASASNWNLE